MPKEDSNNATVLSKARTSIPGILICAVLGIPCWFLGSQFPVVGAPVFGIILGMLIAVFWGAEKRKSIQDGISFTGKKILQYAVILLGFGLNLSQVLAVGAESLPIICSTIATALIVAFIMCKLLHVPGKVATLVGVGSSICGGSAIAATAPVIDADEKDIAQSISVIFLFNVVAALVFPTLGSMLGLTNEGFGLFAGTAVNDTSSVTAAAAAWDGMHPGSNSLDDATIVKLTRTLAIIPITLVLALWTARKSHKSGEGELGKFSIKRAFPIFIAFFLLASVITTIATYLGAPATIFVPFKTVSKYFIVMAMVAIGLNTDIVKLVKSGGKPLLMGLVCWICIAAVSLGMQHVLGLW